jgi:histidinol-phosphate/aromatic aminotransferase/cobyric acid decarboxylase-like protein
MLELQIHGDDSKKRAAKLGLDPFNILDLALNLNPVPPKMSDLLKNALDKAILRDYPDEDQPLHAFGNFLGIDKSRIVFCNGAAEAISLVSRLFVRANILDIDFSLYERHFIRDPLAKKIRSNPHNPTGYLHKKNEEVYIWDEAFYPMTGLGFSRGISENSIVIGSFTKLWACPGLRMGYVILPEEDIAKKLLNLRPLWSLGSLACYVIPRMLERTDIDYISAQINLLRGDLISLLKRYGLSPLDSFAPFVFVPNAADLYEPLLKKGIFVRHCESFMRPDAIRIAVCDSQALERLEKALEEIRG